MKYLDLAEVPMRAEYINPEFFAIHQYSEPDVGLELLLILTSSSFFLIQMVLKFKKKCIKQTTNTLPTKTGIRIFL